MCAVVALALFPASGLGAGTVSRDGSMLVFQGSNGPDSLVVEFWTPPTGGVSEPSYMFRGLPKIKGHDGSQTAGVGCQRVVFGTLGGEVASMCPAAGIDHVEVLMNGGDDFVSAGGYTALPASIAAHGGPGNDGVIGDEKAPSGDEQLFGDAGDDSLTAFSRGVPAHMEGGSGNDSFAWETTERGVATFADGGPGDDVFTADNAHGPDTIVTGSGTDSVSVHNRSGDPDTVDCSGSDGLAALYFNTSDHIDPHCKLDAFARTVRNLKKALQHLGPAAAGSSTVHLTGLRVPRAGKITAKLFAYTRAHGGGIAATATIAVRRSGPVTLAFRVARRGHTLLRFATAKQLQLKYTPAGGREREAFVDA